MTLRPEFDVGRSYASTDAPHAQALSDMTDARYAGPGPHDTEYRHLVMAETESKLDAAQLMAEEARETFKGMGAAVRGLNASLEVAQLRSAIEAELRLGEARIEKSRAQREEASSLAAKFQRAHDRPPLEATAYSRTQFPSRSLLLLLAGIFLLETILTALQIAPDLKGGMPQAVAISVTVGLTMLVCAAVAGIIGVRLLRHRDRKKRGVGICALALSSLVSLLLIGAMTLMRFADGGGDAQSNHLVTALFLSAAQLGAVAFAAWKFAGGPLTPWSSYWGEAAAHRPLHRLNHERQRIVEETRAAIDAHVDTRIAAAEAHCASQRRASAALFGEAVLLRRTTVDCGQASKRALLYAERNWRRYRATWHAKRPSDALLEIGWPAPNVASVDDLIAATLAGTERVFVLTERQLVEFRWIAETLRTESLDRAGRIGGGEGADLETPPTWEQEHSDALPPAAPPAANRGAPRWFGGLLNWRRS